MRLILILAISGQLLCGCSPNGYDANPAPTTPAVGNSSATPVRIGAQPSSTATANVSYEVSIASVGADRVHAQEACESKPKAERAACNAEADAAYNRGRIAAESIRDSYR